MVKSALVLGGGGVAGIAWETGLLLGIHDENPALSERMLGPSTLLIGTSAGSTVAAQIAGGARLNDLFERQIDEQTDEVLVDLDLAEFGAMMAGAAKGAASPEDGRRRVGAIALTATTPETAVRRAVIESRLRGLGWTEHPLLVTAVDAESGRRRVFDRDSGVDLVNAVSASCAVPGIWPAVQIDGTWYMDGGTHSIVNADLAAGAEQVLIVVPAAEASAYGPTIPDAELAALGSARVESVFADAASLESMGSNPLNPESRIPAARAGRVQGRALAPEIAAFWR